MNQQLRVSNKSTLIVYLKCITNENTEPHLMFLQLLALDDQKATTITQALPLHPAGALPPDTRYRLSLRARHAFRQINICHYTTGSGG